MSNKNQQMKIAVVAVLVILLISSIIAAVKSSKSSEPTIKTKDASATSQDVAAKKELVKAVEDLETIKDRIKNVEEYDHREKYRSETNNGLTVVGTLMEQMIDVMVAVLKQPLVAEAVSKRIVNKQDADEIAEYIEMLGQEVVKEVEQTQLLKCRKARTWECEGENSPEVAGRVCGWIEAEGDVPDSNCDAYEVNRMKIREGQRRAVANLYNKVLSVVEKSEERDKMYRIVKNVAIDNMTQYGISTSMSDEDIKSLSEGYPKQDEFENIAMAHYKYLGHELKRELGDSINISELTGEEEDKVRYLTNRNEGRKERAIYIIKFELHEEPDYKGNTTQGEMGLPEGEIIDFAYSKSNPVKSLKLGENVIFEARRVENDEKIELRGEMEDNNTGSGYYDIVIFSGAKPGVAQGQMLEESTSVSEGYRI